MTDSQWWCCCCYEVPYRGVSLVNPAGHLLMALRNKGESRCTGKVFERMKDRGSFSISSGQHLLRGVLGVDQWSLVFAPCVNQVEVNGNASQVRQAVMQALHRTEPGFMQTWLSGTPGTIPLAKIEYLLSVDRNERAYKFDPVAGVWVSSSDGTKAVGTSRSFRELKDVPHTPIRLLIFTTDFEVLAFQLCVPDWVIEDGPNDSDKRKRVSKLHLQRFLSTLTCRLAAVRAHSGMELASEYARAVCTNACLATNQKRALNSNALDEQAFTESLDLFRTRIFSERLKCGSPMQPVNRHPIHPLERLRQTWCHFVREPCWMDNPDFAYCRTYPLRVPCAKFKAPLFQIRTHFEGFRFPILSCIYPSDRDHSSMDNVGVSVYRSGVLNGRTDLQAIIDCDSEVADPHYVDSQKTPVFLQQRLVHIRLHEAPMYVLRTASPGSTDSLSTIASFANGSATPTASVPTRWFVDSSPVSTLVSDSDEFSSLSFRKELLVPRIGSLQSEIEWPAPQSRLIQKSWLRLGSLVRLSQTHIPVTDKTKTRLDLPENALVSSVSSLSVDVLNVRDNSAEDSSLNAFSCADDSEISRPKKKSPLTVFKRDNSNNSERVSVASGLLRRFSAASLYQTNPDTDLHTVNETSPSALRSFLPRNRTLCSLALERAPHRSGWQENFFATRWLDLVLFTLRQAAHLSELIRQLAQDSMRSRNNSLLLFSGPGGGRTWQPVVLSLAQIMLSPNTRTLSGFEDLIEHEWVRYGYPFSPDPSDWFDSAVPQDYDGCATFGLFLDCVHQLMFQYPVEFAFTEDYLVLLMDTALSRGGGLPPFAIEFSCSCEASRCVSTKTKSATEVQRLCDDLYRTRALRSFRDWSCALTPDGLRLLSNWCYWWHTSPDPLNPKKTFPGKSGERTSTRICSHELFPITSPPCYIRCWVHGWLRWVRSLRFCDGGGYAFDAAFYRKMLGPPFESNSSTAEKNVASSENNLSFLRPTTSASPYSGWMSDEALMYAESQTSDSSSCFLTDSPFVRKLVQYAVHWENSSDTNYS
ncbi:unnamed protein product [Calicophoron daubneyi]|uniref:Myotubularin phosphatase domain-containing protein n=1 Tax=Calicophoron daubneyi TaxID=300641 RepID=A0AAV2TE56_CALDB